MSQHRCPRCGAPIKVGQIVCGKCNLRLDPASLQAFYNRIQMGQEVLTGPPAATKRRSAAPVAAIALLFVIMACAAIVFISALARPAAGNTASAAAATPTHAVAHETARTLSGSGMRKTEAFPLLGGSYRFDWTATDTSGTGGGCYMGGSLRSVQGSGYEMLANEMVTGSGSGNTNTYNVHAGQYYLDMSTSCAWSVTISPQ